MLEATKSLALTISVIGFWLSVLVPLFLHFKIEVKSKSNIMKVLVSFTSIIISVVYFIILFYFIWVYNGFI